MIPKISPGEHLAVVYREFLDALAGGGFSGEIQTDYATRLAILQAKAKRQDVPVHTDILEFIAQQIRQNIRDLEGSLNRVVAYSRLLRVLPTLETAQRSLENLASMS
ncbi:MAG: hypothetical protein ACK2U9_00625, partial [Anaerolineae bacterium]